jgi:hypothetical protein
MSLLRIMTAAVVAVMSVVCSSVAIAETARVRDRAGDGQDGRNYDITAIRVDNGDFAVTTRVSFRRVVTPGDISIAYSVRADHVEAGAIVSSKVRARGVINRFWTPDGVIECRGLSAEWDFRADFVDISFPSRCLEHGNYGAFKVQVIAERSGGSEADFAPKDDHGNWRWKRWLSRG